MTPKSLFQVVLKILGIFFIKDLLVDLSSLLPVFFYSGDADQFSGDMLIMIIEAVAFLLIRILIIYILVFRTDWVVRVLKLDRGFDQEQIPLSLHRSAILSISIIVIGGLILVDAIPELLKQIRLYFDYRSISQGRVNPSLVSYTILSASKIFIGGLLIIYRRHLVNFMELKGKRKMLKS